MHGFWKAYKQQADGCLPFSLRLLDLQTPEFNHVSVSYYIKSFN